MKLLKTARKEKGLSQTDLARAVGVTTAAVSSWESGRFDPSLANALKVAEILGCTIDEIVGDDDGAENGRKS